MRPDDLDASASLGTVRDLLSQRPQTLETASPGDTLRRVIAKMKSLGISQLPVLGSDGAVVGLVTEVAVLRSLVSGDGHFDAPIEGILDADFATVSPDDPVELLKAALADGKVALVTESARPLGIITKIDLIDYLARRVGDGGLVGEG